MSEVCQVVRTAVRHPGRAIANDIFLLKAKGHDYPTTWEIAPFFF